MIELTRQYGRYGYSRIAALLRDAGWQVNDKRVERLWRREGLKVPMKQPKKGRLWLNDGSCVRLRPEYRNHVWSYDFVHHRTDDGRAFRTLNILDEHSRECLAIRVKRKLNSTEVIDALTDLFILRGVPSYIGSDNGPEFIAEAVRDWIKAVGANQFKCVLTYGGTGLFSDLVVGINKKPVFYEGAKCSMQCPEINVVYDNCFVDKMKDASKTSMASVRRSCKRIACNPTFFQKLNYK